MIANGGNGSGGVTFWPLTLLNNHESAAAATSPSWSWFATGGTVLATLLGSVFLVLVKRQKSVRKEALKKKSADAHHPHDGEVEAEPVAIEIGNGIYKSAYLKDDEREVIDAIFPEAKTLYQTFLRGMQESEDGKCIGKRVGSEYQFLSYSEVFKLAGDFGSAITGKLGIKPGNDTNIAIYGRNCQEWFISSFACVRFSMVVVPLYDTLGPDTANYILKHTEAKLVVVDNEEKAKKVLNSVCSPHLEHIIIIDDVDDAKLAALKQLNPNVQIHRFYELIKAGAEDSRPDVEPNPEDVYIICYTSGTTGTPKGVVLTHRNVVANYSAVVTSCQRNLPEVLTPDNAAISYLPLSHMFEQVSHWTCFSFGAKVGYFSGNVTELSNDMKALRPTIFPVVPRILNRLNDALKMEVSKGSFLVKQIFNLAYQRKLAEVRRGVISNTTIWDRIVFKKAQNQLGGNVRYVITGSAPISAEVLEMCRIAFGAHICEGYGQTECTAMASSTCPGDNSGGNCGGPATCAVLKLEDVPDLNYYAKDRKGEVLIKGPSVTRGYYKQEEKTAELIDTDGFVHTGDVGQILPNGALKIIDRRKHIFKLAQGEYVAPEKIENVYVQSLYVQQVFVDGDSLERFLVAVVVPIQKPLVKLYHEIHGTTEGDANEPSFEEMCKDNQAILDDMVKLGKANKLNTIEQVKAVHIEPEAFTVENGLLTPTLKSKRPQIRQKYSDVIKNLYKNAQ